MFILTFVAVAAAGAQTFTLTVLPITIPAATQGQAYSQMMDAAGGFAPYSFAVTSGALPSGITLSSAGLLGGTSNSPGSYSFTITATDSMGNTGFRPYTFSMGTAGGLTVNPSSLPDGSVGVSYPQTITASGGTGGPYTFSISSGSLPPGVTMNSAGAISGTPTSGGPFTFTVRAIDTNGNTGTRIYNINIGANILTVSPPTLPNGAVGSAYTQTVTASGGTGSGYTFAVTSGSLPTGTSINSSGNITGTPSAPGAFTFTIRATDSGNNVGSRQYTVNVGSNILTVTPASQPNGTVGVAYSQNFGASGGTGGPYTFARTSGALPTGLSLSAGGTLSGTPTAGGTFNFDITATDGNFNTGTRSYSLVINAAPLVITPAILPPATLSTPYTVTLSTSGGTAPYDYTLISGTLPNGVTLSSGGTISGTPTQTGSFAITVQSTDVTPNTGTRSYTLVVGSNILVVAPATLPNGSVGTAYSQMITASGGTSPYSFTTAGPLPPGVTLASSGALSGTPTSGGSFSFTVNASDSAGNTGSHVYTVNIGTSSLTVTPATLPNGTQNVAYTSNVSATGGTGGPYTFTISAGALPAGLTMNSAGAISGTPTGSGASSFTVRALDGQGNFGTQAYNVNIGTVSLTVNPSTLPPSIVGRPYTVTFTGAGGTGPYTFTLAGGSLPPGLTLNGTTGVLSGTPTSSAVANFTIQARDINGNIGSRDYAMTSRADPATDPEVRGLILSQVAVAQRFASTQVANITRHLENLHEHFTPCGFNFAITPQGAATPLQPYGAPYGGQSYDPNALYSPNGQYGGQYGAPPPQYGAPPEQEERGPLGYAQEYRPGYGPFGAEKGDPMTTGADLRLPRQPQYYEPQVQPAPQQKRLLPCSSDWATNMAFWTSGSVQFGSATSNGALEGSKFTTSGLTAGVDIRPTDALIVGLAIGYGADRSDVGINGSRSDSSSLSAALYACMRLFNPIFLDAALGYGTLDYNNRRFVTGEGTFAEGRRKGSYFYGAAKLSAELQRGRFKFSPYVLAEFNSTSLDGYSETGSTLSLLTYDSMKFNAVTGVVGLRGSIDIPMSFGTLTPNARIEYRSTSTSAFDQALYYTDLGSGSSSTFGQPVGVRNVGTGTLGLRARSVGGLGVEIEYSYAAGSDSYQSQTIRGAMRVPF